MASAWLSTLLLHTKKIKNRVVYDIRNIEGKYFGWTDKVKERFYVKRTLNKTRPDLLKYVAHNLVHVSKKVSRRLIIF